MFPTIAEMGLHFAPLERDRFAFARSINMSSLRDEEDCLEKPCQKTREVDRLLSQIREVLGRAVKPFHRSCLSDPRLSAFIRG
jgi:hypothetical protein